MSGVADSTKCTSALRSSPSWRATSTEYPVSDCSPSLMTHGADSATHARITPRDRMERSVSFKAGSSTLGETSSVTTDSTSGPVFAGVAAGGCPGVGAGEGACVVGFSGAGAPVGGVWAQATEVVRASNRSNRADEATVRSMGGLRIKSTRRMIRRPWFGW